MAYRVRGSGFRFSGLLVWVLGFHFSGSGCGFRVFAVQGLGFHVWGTGFRVWGQGFQLGVSRFRVSRFEVSRFGVSWFGVSVRGFKVCGFKIRGVAVRGASFAIRGFGLGVLMRTS